MSIKNNVAHFLCALLRSFHAGVMPFFAVALCPAFLAAQVQISGRVVPALNASVQVKHNGTTTTFAVNAGSGDWSFSLTGSGSYEVRAFNARGDLCDPPLRVGAAVSQGGLDFALRESVSYRQITGKVSLNGDGVGDVEVEITKLGRVFTSLGGNGELPRGMFHFTYRPYTPLGVLTATPRKNGVMTFIPSARTVNGDLGFRGLDFEIPGSNNQSPPPGNSTPPPPSAPTHNISGRVTNTAGQPLAGVTIFGGPEIGNRVTDGNGHYLFTNVPEGLAIGFAPVYSPHYFSPQSANYNAGITTDIVQNFVGAPLDGPPVFILQPQDQQANQYYAATFRVVVFGALPRTTYQWYRNGIAIPGATLNVLEFPTARDDDGAVYHVVASNPYGSTASTLALLDVHTVPVVVTEPVDQTVYAGEPVSFSVVARGEGAVDYFWLTSAYNFPGTQSSSIVLRPDLDAQGNVIFPGGNQILQHSGNVVEVYVLVSNSVGNAISRGAKLTVLPKPAGGGSPTSPVTSVPGGQAPGNVKSIVAKAAALPAPATLRGDSAGLKQYVTDVKNLRREARVLLRQLKQQLRNPVLTEPERAAIRRDMKALKKTLRRLKRDLRGARKLISHPTGSI